MRVTTFLVMDAKQYTDNVSTLTIENSSCVCVHFLIYKNFHVFALGEIQFETTIDKRRLSQVGKPAQDVEIPKFKTFENVSSMVQIRKINEVKSTACCGKAACLQDQLTCFILRESQNDAD
jgi:hypothetical protein